MSVKTTTQGWTVAHFRRLLALLEYSPIGAIFLPTTAGCTLHTAKKKIGRKKNLL
jgi:hypothetical protein